MQLFISVFYVFIMLERFPFLIIKTVFLIKLEHATAAFLWLCNYFAFVLQLLTKKSKNIVLHNYLISLSNFLKNLQKNR